ncbi:MAG: polysaccharide pyruvyl transferase family protein [Campylobacterota bacterium]|nr:polysaccharide pyruvyl transferase family protein [Campylobacterota bacterium]
MREPIAKRLMDELKIESKLTFDCASIYLSKLDQELLVNVTPYQEYIVLSSSVIANQKTEVIFKDSIIELIRQNKNVVLLNGGPHEEKVFLENLYKHFKSEKQVSFLETKSVEHFLSIIKNATMLISGRFHYSIIAMFLQCPFVLLNSNTSKNFGLIEMTQLPNKILSFDLANLKDELLREVLKIEKEPKKYSLQESELKRLENLAKGNFIT